MSVILEIMELKCWKCDKAVGEVRAAKVTPEMLEHYWCNDCAEKYDLKVGSKHEIRAKVEGLLKRGEIKRKVKHG